MIKEKPIAFCTACHEYSRNESAIDHEHKRTKYGDKCKGIFSCAIGVNDWSMCPSCNGTGKTGLSIVCVQCSGEGWILNR